MSAMNARDTDEEVRDRLIALFRAISELAEKIDKACKIAIEGLSGERE